MRPIVFRSQASLADILELIRDRASRSRARRTRVRGACAIEARAIEAPAWTLTPSDRFQPEGDHAAIGVVVRPWSRSGMVRNPWVPHFRGVLRRAPAGGSGCELVGEFTLYPVVAVFTLMPFLASMSVALVVAVRVVQGRYADGVQSVAAGATAVAIVAAWIVGAILVNHQKRQIRDEIQACFATSEQAPCTSQEPASGEGV